MTRGVRSFGAVLVWTPMKWRRLTGEAAVGVRSMRPWTASRSFRQKAERGREEDIERAKIDRPTWSHGGRPGVAGA